jgi:hypothetical protein
MKREVIEQIAFSDVRIGERSSASAAPGGSIEAGRSQQQHHTADLAQKGWSVPVPDGFRKTREGSAASPARMRFRSC